MFGQLARTQNASFFADDVGLQLPSLTTLFIIDPI